MLVMLWHVIVQTATPVRRLEAGNARRQYCRGTLSCMGPQSEMLNCIDNCAGGLSGEDGLSFELNYTCLQALAADSTCDEINGCNEPWTPEAVCSAVCQAQSDCELLADGQNADSCQAACLLEVSDNLDAYVCALRAGRVANGCIDLAECLNIDVPPADPSCVTQCAARAQCDASTDQFLCERRCDPSVDGTELRLACLEASAECPSVLACLDNQLEDPSICNDICTTLSQCDGQLGEDGRYLDVPSCETECGIEALVNQESEHAVLRICLGEAACVDEAIETCFTGSQPTCDNAWTPMKNVAMTQISCGL